MMERQMRTQGGMQVDDQAMGLAKYRVLAGCCLGSFFNISTVIIYSFGVFAVGIADELGIDRLSATKLIGPALLLTIVAQPVIGQVIDTWPRRNVTMAALVLLAVAAALIAFAPANTSAMTITITGAVGLSCLASPGIYNAYLSDSFIERRGFALGISAAFTGLGIAVLPSIAGNLVAAYGWRMAYLAFAGAIACAALINMLLLPRTVSKARPERGKARDVLAATLRRPIFWRLAVIFFLTPLAANALPIYLPLILSERGADAELAAAGLTALGVTMIVSRPVLGYLIDRFAPWKVVVGMLCGPIAGSLTLILSNDIYTGIFAAVGFGIGIGGEFVALGFLVARIFGLKHFGMAYGLLSMAVAAGVAIGPIIVGALVREADFTRSLVVIAIAALFAILLSVGLRAEAAE
jgi:MFS family permease